MDVSDYEIAALQDGRFEVRLLGGVAIPEMFATRAEAEDWIFRQTEARGGDEPIRPGDGEGLR